MVLILMVHCFLIWLVNWSILKTFGGLEFPLICTALTAPPRADIDLKKESSSRSGIPGCGKHISTAVHTTLDPLCDLAQSRDTVGDQGQRWHQLPQKLP